ncbi:MAG TPA: Gfo/Idh/MocA family oxidoreductase, partial [Sedimentisphaerales bacterium]|nr:Gfo/Idh/MocA family oxidoreductase [Sedimentisphaerales bacterium]
MVGRGTRRTFLRNAALGGMGFLLLNDSRSARTYAANERVNLAIVGVSGRGGWFSETMPKLANVVAMCDVNDRRAAPYYKAIPQARTFHDFRRMLEEMGGQIDAVTVATPDHTHAAITAAAIRRGKHVLCEKPLTHDVFEARMLRALAREYKVATQMGNQGTASEAFRRGVELIQAGTLGQIREVHAWNTGGGAGERPIPTEEHPVPDFL